MLWRKAIKATSNVTYHPCDEQGKLVCGCRSLKALTEKIVEHEGLHWLACPRSMRMRGVRPAAAMFEDMAHDESAEQAVIDEHMKGKML